MNTAAGQEVYVTLAAGTVDNYSWKQKAGEDGNQQEKKTIRN